MGFGSAVYQFDEVIDAVFAMLNDTQGINLTDEEQQEAMRPVITKVAKMYSDLDWDTQEESDYFRMFPKEILPDMEEEDYWWNQEDDDG